MAMTLDSQHELANRRASALSAWPEEEAHLRSMYKDHWNSSEIAPLPSWTGGLLSNARDVIGNLLISPVSACQTMAKVGRPSSPIRRASSDRAIPATMMAKILTKSSSMKDRPSDSYLCSSSTMHVAIQKK